MIGVFDRSHYEDVLIGRVREFASLPQTRSNGATVRSTDSRGS